MSKYIIELKDDVQVAQIVGVTENGNAFVMNFYKDQLEELNSDYINEHYGDLQDTAYKRGVNDGSLDVKERVDGAYQRGFEDGKKEAESSEHIKSITADAFNKGMLFKEEKINDAFKRGFEKGKAVHDKGCEGCKYEGKTGEHLPCDYCMNNFKNQWTAKDDEIEVGDEVEWTEDENVVIVVTSVYMDDGNIEWCDGVCKDGKAYSILTKNARKTGRHFDIDKFWRKCVMTVDMWIASGIGFFAGTMFGILIVALMAASRD